MNTLELLEKAINEQKTISFNYKLEGERFGNPHAIFVSSTGKINCDIYQLAGHSNSNIEKGWKICSLNSITDIIITENKFEIENTYKSNSEKYNKAICKIN